MRRLTCLSGPRTLQAIASALLLVALAANAVTNDVDDLAAARTWAAARFEGVAPSLASGPALVVLANYGPVQKNARGDKPLRIAGEDYRRGLYCHAFSKVAVRLPAPGATFSAIAGVDSNDQTSGGRGSVEFSVSVAGVDKHRSGVVREGMAGKTVSVNLDGATEFVLQVDPTADGISCDQADWAEAKVVLQNGREVWLGDLPLIEAAAQRLFSTAPPFSFLFDGQASSNFLKNWKREHHSRELAPRWPRSAEPAGSTRTEHTVTWTDPRTALQVRCVAIAYADFPVVEWTVHFKNTGNSDTPLIENIQALDVDMDRGMSGEFVLHQQAGDDCSANSYAPLRLRLGADADHRIASAGGRPTTGAFPYFNIEWSGGGLIAVLGWPGQWAARFKRDAGTGLRVCAGQELTRFRLRPGEEVRAPLVALQFWHGDRVRAQNLWRRWMLAHNLPRDREGRLLQPILTSCSGGFFPGLQCMEATERQFISTLAAAGLQLDYWWCDAGWYPCGGNWPNVGTWTVDPLRFPRGLKAVSDLAHANKMGLIVWFEPERVAPGTFLYTNNPAWLLGRDGAQKLLNLGHSEARKWLTDHVDATLTREGIDFYRQDFNMDPLPYWRAADAPDRQGLTEIRHVEGYLAYWDELRRRHPGLWIDSCASGGRRNDLETLRRAVPLLRSDYQAFDGNPAYAPGNQGHTYGLSSWIPYYGQGVYFTDRDFVYSVRSYLSPAFAICADVRKPGVDLALVRRLAEQWQRVADCFLGDFHPLTSYRLDEDVWMAWQFDRPEAGKGMVQVFRRSECPYESARFPLRGLDPAASYEVTDLDTSHSERVSGRELLERGLAVTMKDRPQAVLIDYHRITK